jgi:LCCL domain
MIRLLGAVAVVAAALALPAGPSAHQRAVVLPAGSDWNATAASFRGKNGTQVSFLCPADGRPATAWGTDVYTDDSSVCTAALHTGAITIADGGTVTIEIRPGQASYTASTRNGVTTTAYGSWSGSFAVVGATAGGGVAGVKMGGAGWATTAVSHRGHNGTRYRYVCPSGGTFATVWGTNVYTDDSSVCTAAVHVGVITAAGGGNVTIEMRPGQKSYVSFAHNGVTTRAYASWNGSFVLAGAPPIPGSPSGGGGGGGGGSTTTTGGGGGAAAPPTATPTGTVLVNGRPFTGGTIPYRSTVDVTDGTVLLKADTGTLKVNGAGGIPAVFVLLRGTDGKKPIVELRLKKGDFSVCPKRKKSSARRAAATTVRQLWGSGKGRFRTRGKYASATVRGTKWLTADRCDGTNIKVSRGVIQVADFPKRTQVTIRAGRSYLAKP